ncbi:hypothetical protein FJZ19_02840 [Candidatus Pacearchaeota archaeon]|nr:hypothetical protein [Candidatus Pacearchaeota archaeon]
MNKNNLSLLFGIMAGILDFIFILYIINFEIAVSVLAFWIIFGFLFSRLELWKGAEKGIILAVIMIIPLAIIVGWQDNINLIPIALSAIFLGALIGFFSEKLSR